MEAEASEEVTGSRRSTEGAQEVALEEEPRGGPEEGATAQAVESML